jgi:hypothetical protein
VKSRSSTFCADWTVRGHAVSFFLKCTPARLQRDRVAR